MKSKYITLSIALCSILGVSSCDSYLDINPKQVLDQNILNKPSDIKVLSQQPMPVCVRWGHWIPLLICIGGVVLCVRMTATKVVVVLLML